MQADPGRADDRIPSEEDEARSMPACSTEARTRVARSRPAHTRLVVRNYRAVPPRAARTALPSSYRAHPISIIAGILRHRLARARITSGASTPTTIILRHDHRHRPLRAASGFEACSYCPTGAAGSSSAWPRGSARSRAGRERRRLGRRPVGWGSQGGPSIERVNAGSFRDDVAGDFADATISSPRRPAAHAAALLRLRCRRRGLRFRYPA